MEVHRLRLLPRPLTHLCHMVVLLDIPITAILFAMQATTWEVN